MTVKMYGDKHIVLCLFFLSFVQTKGVSQESWGIKTELNHTYIHQTVKRLKAFGYAGLNFSLKDVVKRNEWF